MKNRNWASRPPVGISSMQHRTKTLLIDPPKIDHWFVDMTGVYFLLPREKNPTKVLTNTVRVSSHNNRPRVVIIGD